MSDNLDIKHYATKMLNQTKNLPGNYSFPLPVKRLRALCNAVLENDAEPEQLPVLTDVERSVLSAIEADVMQGIKPTLRTIQNRLDYESPNSAKVAVDRLIKHGYLKREGSKRQIVVVSSYKYE